MAAASPLRPASNRAFPWLRIAWRTFTIIGLSIVVGCGPGRYPVHGKVTYADGTPVDAGTVIAEAKIDGKLVAVQANIEPDGSFELGGMQAGDGALPGFYKAVVMPVALGDAELAAGKTPAVDGKYTRFDSSEIQFQVIPDDNTVEIKVARPKAKASGQ